MKQYFLGFLVIMLLANTGKAFSQVVVSGKVFSKKQPVPGASITIKDTYDGTTTDSSGNFSFSTAEKGAHTILITAVGYKPFEQMVTLAGQPVSLAITMKEEVTELNAVIV